MREEANRTVSVYIRGRGLGELDAAPGQFFRWRFLTRGLWWQSHPYSLSALPSDDLMRITVRDVGDPSNMLRSLRPGTRVLAEGPFGAFFPARSRRSRPALLLAGGVGITPLRAMMAALTGSVTLVYRASSWQDVALRVRTRHARGRARRPGPLRHRHPIAARRRPADGGRAARVRARP